MAKISAHQSSDTTKLLLIGNTGAGKTGSLASLARAGYNLRILDLDNGLDVLKNFVVAAGPEVADRVVFKTLTDPMKSVNGKLIPKKAEVWIRMIKLLDNWTVANGADEDLGPVSSWTPQDVLVIDSLTFASNAAMNHIMALNGKLGGQREQSHWYLAQELVEGLLQTLYDEGIRCNVIVLCHITYIETGMGMAMGYPNTLGKALPPKVGRYFNSMLMVKSVGAGSGLKRKIHTTTVAGIELKNTAPLKVKTEYDLDTGLAEYFRDLRK